jgi:hypothetical protein
MFYLEINEIAKWKYVVEKVVDDSKQEGMIFVHCFCNAINSKRIFWLSKEKFDRIKKTTCWFNQRMTWMVTMWRVGSKLVITHILGCLAKCGNNRYRIPLAR